MVCDTQPSQDASTHPIWNSYLKEYRRYASDTKRDGRTDIFITIKTKSEVKVNVTQKWYATLRHPKMHPHTKFGVPTSKNIRDMHRTRSGTDGRTVRLLYASQSSFGGIKKKHICPRVKVYDTLLLPCGRSRLIQRRGRVFACRSSDLGSIPGWGR